MDTFTVIASIGGILGGVGGIGAWFAALQARTAARILAGIETARRHQELRPQFTITCTDKGNDYAILDVKLTGPDDLDRLDSVTVAIRDDRRHEPSPTAGGPTAEDLARTVFGPLKFRHGVSGADEVGRTANPVALELDDEARYALDRTNAPKWQDGPDSHQNWRRDYADKPLRLRLSCVREGQEPWVIPVEVKVGPHLPGGLPGQ